MSKMRLICPNCDAHYEVPDDVIPPEGRDVQCSSCGNTWFQPPAGVEDPEEIAPAHDRGPDDDPVGAPADGPEDMPERQPDINHDAAPEPQQDPAADVAEDDMRAAPAPSAAEMADPALDDELDDEDGPASPPPNPALQPNLEPRQLDPDIASVLREEAARETRVRAAEMGAVESQPDLGLDDMGGSMRSGDIRAKDVPGPAARPRGPNLAVPAMAAAAATSSRRELLPDIEEINSTLRSTDQPRHSEISEEIAAEPTRHARSSFRRGLMLVLLSMTLAVLAYVYADVIAAKVPGMAPTLVSYVDWVDGLRGWLDQKVLAGLQWLDGMSAESATPTE